MTQLIAKASSEGVPSAISNQINFLSIADWTPATVGRVILHGSLLELMQHYHSLQANPPLYLALAEFDINFLSDYKLLQQIAPLLYISKFTISKLHDVFSGVVLCLDAGEQFLWRKVNIADIFQFVRLCKQRRWLIGLDGPFAIADIPRLLPYHLNFLLLEPELLEEWLSLLPIKSESQLFETQQLMRIYVRDYILDMNVGIYAHEYATKQRVCFNVILEVLAPYAMSPHIRDIFSYDIVLDAISDLVTHSHIDFVETLAEMLCSRLLQHEMVQSIQVRVEKLDLAPKAVGIEIKKTKTENSFANYNSFNA